MWRWLRFTLEALWLLVPGAATATFLFFDFYGIWDMVTDRTIEWQGWALISFCVFAVAVVIDFARLLRVNADLRDTRCNLRVRFEPDIHPYYWPAWGYRIGIYNEGPAMAEEIEVMLNNTTGDSTHPLLEANVLPSRLGHKDGYCQGDHCNINVHAEHFYDLLNLRNEKGVWVLLTIVQTRIVLLEGMRYLFELVVSARNDKGGAIRPVLEIRPRGDGLLNIKPFPSRAAAESIPTLSPESTPDMASPEPQQEP